MLYPLSYEGRAGDSSPTLVPDPVPRRALGHSAGA